MEDQGNKMTLKCVTSIHKEVCEASYLKVNVVGKF